MPLSEAKKQSNMRYNSKAYEQIAIKSRREFCINRRIELAANDKGMSKNAFLLSIIESALFEAGYPKPNKTD